MDAYNNTPPETVEISIDKAENGYICTVTYPKHLIPNPALDQAQDIFNSLGKMQAGGPEDLVKVFGNAMMKLKRPNKPLRRSQETYIFSNIDAMLQFIKETFESVDMKSEQNP